MKGASRPMVTMGICVRNCEDRIEGVIGSVSQQDFPHKLIEVIFVDDGSEDSTLSVIRELTSKLDFSLKIFSGSWKGLGFARQVVVDNAEGKYIVWVDCDMVLSRNYVRLLVEFMEENPLVGVAKGTYALTSEGNLISMLEDIPFVVHYRQYSGKPIEKFPGSGGSIYRASAIAEVDGFDRRITGAAEDVDLEYRIREAGWLVYAAHGIFSVERPRTWSVLWKKYFGYGYGMHYVLHKNREVERLYEMSPAAAFLQGILCSVAAYRIVRKKAVFLLPFHFVFKMSAWFLGFSKAHLDSYMP